MLSESLVLQRPSGDWDTGSHMSNSATQFCSVLTGTMMSTQRASVWRRKTSTNAMTCTVLPSPILCASMQPRPLFTLHRSTDSMTLSYRNRIPPIYQNKTIIVPLTCRFIITIKIEHTLSISVTYIVSSQFSFHQTAVNSGITTVTPSPVNKDQLKSRDIYDKKLDSSK